ncbi:hypothetical protein RJT34_17516 [Clitoria ternatea]|uniref:DUF674 family protein n=1 Tax=Clitoria ternatea TaxID=43366 RepID=A0AAN9J938_CLITE
MASTATPSSDEQFVTVPLKVLVHKEKNRLVSMESNIEPVRVGSLSSLYQSVTVLDEQYLCSQTCKEMLLQPKNSMEAYCQNLKLNIDDTEPTTYFACANWHCNRVETRSLLSTFRNQRCHCGKIMNEVMDPQNQTPAIPNGFVMETATLIICDDLSVLPNAVVTNVDLLRTLGVEDIAVLEEQVLHISKKEINVKVLVRKSDGKVLFAEAEEDFVDFLFSFLCFPLGGVLHMLRGSSSSRCMDKLYNGISALSTEKYFGSQELKDKIVNPQCAPLFNLDNLILPIGTESLPVFYFNTYYVSSCRWKGYSNNRGEYINERLESCALVASQTSPDNVFHNYIDAKYTKANYVDPMSSVGKSSRSRGFTKGASMFMVTDDLIVSPASSVSGVSYINRLKVPLFDLEEKIIRIGSKEGLGILKASLTSTSALTNALKHLFKTIKEEN